MDISFSTRFEHIVDITNTFIARGQHASNARDEARFMEAEILKNSSSLDEYIVLCEELVATSTTLAGPSEEPCAEPLDEILNEEGPTFGNYAAATFHRDGQTSTVFKARAMKPAASVPIVALKVTTPSRMEPPHNAEREARILAEARHESVLPLIETFWHEGNRFVLVFPFMRQDLENLLRTSTLTRSQSQVIFRGLFSALRHLHSLNIIHRDVKPSNILLKSMDGPVYLADFGIAWSTIDLQSEAANTKITDVGTTCYRPPELLFGDKAYDTSLDIWAAGCVVAEMVRHQHYQLFDAGPLGSELGLIKSIFTTLGTPDEAVWPSVARLPDWGKVRFQDFQPQAWNEILPKASPDEINFVQRTVCYESSRRLTAAEALLHPIAVADKQR